MRLNTIQALRGLAALLVALYHLVLQEQVAITQAGHLENAWLSPLTRNGFAGVDLFFVISGFIMVYVTHGRPRNKAILADFLLARVGRIYPLWWFFSLILILCVLAVTGQWVADDFNIPAGHGLGFILKSLFLVPQDQFPYLMVGWTLIHEMYFYLIFALLLLAPRSWLVPLLAVWTGIVALGSLAGLAEPTASSFLALVIHPLTLEFIAGCLIGILFMSGFRKGGLISLLLGGLWFVVALLFIDHDVESMALNYERLIAYGLPACLILYGLVVLETETRVSVPGWAIELGNASYALYLSHIIVFLFLRRGMELVVVQLDDWNWPDWLIAPLRLGQPGLLDNLVFLSVGLAGVIVVSLMTHRYVEVPSLKWISRHRRRLRDRLAFGD